MPNGRPFDHPYSDVVHHGMTVFGPVIDGLIREVDQAGGMDEAISSLLLKNDPRFRTVEGPPDDVKGELRRFLARRKGQPG